MIRQTVLLKRILSYFATPTQLREYVELVSKNKGSASHMAFRLIEKYFEKRAKRENPLLIRENKEEQPRTIKVNSRHGTTFWML